MKKYQIIYADPPWNYKVYSKKGLGRSAESHYPTMSIEDICALPVGNLADKDCALFLWVTIPCLSFGWRTMIDNRSLIRNKEREVPTWEHGA